MKNKIIKLLGGYTKEELQLIYIKNEAQKNLEATHYWKTITCRKGIITPLLLTERELKIAINRGKKNPEDIK
jgi:hypothetical protein